MAITSTVRETTWAIYLPPQTMYISSYKWQHYNIFYYNITYLSPKVFLALMLRLSSFICFWFVCYECHILLSRWALLRICGDGLWFTSYANLSFYPIRFLSMLGEQDGQGILISCFTKGSRKEGPGYRVTALGPGRSASRSFMSEPLMGRAAILSIPFKQTSAEEAPQIYSW